MNRKIEKIQQSFHTKSAQKSEANINTEINAGCDRGLYSYLV
ncbi:MAG: hypothetical protein AAGC85_25575 [Bacteroidota bacterium]